MKVPKKLKKQPIVDSIFEIRFESSYPLDIVPGLITNFLSNLKEINQFPILQIPEQIRASDAKLKYSAYYKANLDTFIVQFGARMIALSSPIPYVGWEEFFSKIKEVTEGLLKSKLVTNIERLGQRGINFFETDILSNSKVKMTNPISFEKTQYQYTNFFKKEDIYIKTMIANKASYQTGDQIKIGSIIDIDAFIEGQVNSNYDSVIDLVDKLHSTGKSVFFEMLKPEFINTMEPEYE